MEIKASVNIFEGGVEELVNFSIRDRYNKEKKKNRNANITLATICKYIIKYNKNLESFANEILDKIPNKYK